MPKAPSPFSLFTFARYLYLYELEHFEGEDDGSHDGHNHEISGNTSEDHSGKNKTRPHTYIIYTGKICAHRHVQCVRTDATAAYPRSTAILNAE